MIKRIFHSFSCINEFIKCVSKVIKRSAILTVYLFSLTCLIDSMSHNHSFEYITEYVPCDEAECSVISNCNKNKHCICEGLTGYTFCTLVRPGMLESMETNIGKQ